MKIKYILTSLTLITVLLGCNKKEKFENTEVYGVVTDTSGHPIEGISVTLKKEHSIQVFDVSFTRPHSSVVNSVLTDVNGNYRFKFYYRKSYFIDFYKAYYAYVSSHYNNSVDFNKLRKLNEEDVFKSALHPRLKQPMRTIDLFTFVAEHDDHHLAKITEIIIFK